MDTDRKPRKVSYQNQPAVAVRFVCTVIPLQDEPEYQCRKQTGVGIYFTLYGTEPERIAPRISQCSYQARTHNGYNFSCGQVGIVRTNQFFCQVRDAPKEEKNTRRTHECAHYVNHHRHVRRVGCKLAKQISRQHKKRCAGRMSDFQLIACSDKLRAIPETCGRFYCQAVDGCRNDECKPTHKVVYGSVLFH